MRASPRWSQAVRARVLLASLASMLLATSWIGGCASAPPPAVPPGPFEPLKATEGFLVVQIEADVAIDRIEADGRVIARSIPPGRHLWAVRMKAGRHRWTAVKLLAQSKSESAVRPESELVLNDREFEFDVEAGAINYPGSIVVQKRFHRLVLHQGVHLSSKEELTIRNRNHSAMALRALVTSHRELVATHPIRYAGMSGDRFLQFYTGERARLPTRAASDGHGDL